MAHNYRELIRTVEGWPKPGISFLDISPVLADPHAFRTVVQAMADHVPADTTKLAAMDARGFLFAAAIGFYLHIGVVMIRKQGKLPGECIQQDYTLEYSSGTLEMQHGLVEAGDQVTLIDDILATGGTLLGASALIRAQGAAINRAVIFAEIAELKGRDILLDVPVYSLVKR